MRRLYISMMLLLACVGSMWAADDDDHLILDLTQYTVLIGEQTGPVEVSVVTAGDTLFRSMQCDLYLPEGVEIAKDDNDSEKFQVSVNRPYLDKEDGDAAEQYQVKVAYREKTDTTKAFYRIVLYSLDSKEFVNTAKASTVPLVQLVLVASDDKVEGEKGTWTLAGQQLAMDAQSSMVPVDQNGVFTYDYATAVLSENNLKDPKPGKKNRVQLNRTLKGQEWNTLCLPFDITGREFIEAFGSGAKLAQLTGGESDSEHVNMKFTQLAVAQNDEVVVEAGGCYLLWMEADEVHPLKFESPRPINPNADYYHIIEFKGINGGYAAVMAQHGTYKRIDNETNEYDTDDCEYILFFQKNNLYYTQIEQKNIQMKGFRWFLHGTDVDNIAKGSSSAKFTFTVGDEDVTIIDGVPVGGAEVGHVVYTLQGQLVGRDVELKRLHKGVYIVDGKKMTIK